MIDQIYSQGESLAGSFLISTPQMPDSRFEEHVIYICAHNDEGAMGVAINRPNPAFSMIEILRGSNMPIPDTGFTPCTHWWACRIGISFYSVSFRV